MRDGERVPRGIVLDLADQIIVEAVRDPGRQEQLESLPASPKRLRFPPEMPWTEAVALAERHVEEQREVARERRIALLNCRLLLATAKKVLANLAAPSDAAADKAEAIPSDFWSRLALAVKAVGNDETLLKSWNKLGTAVAAMELASLRAQDPYSSSVTWDAVRKSLVEGLKVLNRWDKIPAEHHRLRRTWPLLLQLWEQHEQG